MIGNRTSMERKLVVQQLITAYEDYISVLGQSERALLGLAYTHGYRCPNELVKHCEQLRDDIARYKEILKRYPLP